MTRILLIGNGGAGKTSLVKALNGFEVTDSPEAPTPRIEIGRWQGHGQDWRAEFWDFGGQVVMHATHQFFLRKRCVYVLVLQPRDDFAVQDQAEYWLEHVKVFGHGAPVLVAVNKCDLIKLALDEAKLQQKYPNIVGFYPLSCTNWDNQRRDNDRYYHWFKAFRAALLGEVVKIAEDNVLFAKEQAVMEAVRQLAEDQDYIGQARFQQICSEQGFDTDPAQRKNLLELLDLLGVVVHFEDLGIDDLILNPRWLTYGVYAVLTDEKLKAGSGQVAINGLCDLLQGADLQDQGRRLHYPADKVRTVITAAMREFKICYPLLGQHNTLVIPEHLPNRTPTDLGFDKAAALGFQFKFELLLPRHLLYALMADRHREIRKAWKEGVLLESVDYRCRALVEADHQTREIALWLAGADPGRYLAVLRDGLLQSLAPLRGLDYQDG